MKCTRQFALTIAPAAGGECDPTDVIWGINFEKQTGGETASGDSGVIPSLVLTATMQAYFIHDDLGYCIPTYVAVRQQGWLCNELLGTYDLTIQRSIALADPTSCYDTVPPYTEHPPQLQSWVEQNGVTVPGSFVDWINPSLNDSVVLSIEDPGCLVGMVTKLHGLATGNATYTITPLTHP